MKMDFRYVILLAASLLAVGHAKTIVVGGSEKWRFGFNYTDWALKNSPFYINDTLLFKYDRPSDTSLAYSLYLLPNLYSYITCDFSNAKLLANPMQGSGKGFKYVLNQWRPHYFASGELNGYNCNVGMMKLFAVPWPHSRK